MDTRKGEITHLSLKSSERNRINTLKFILNKSSYFTRAENIIFKLNGISIKNDIKRVLPFATETSDGFLLVTANDLRTGINLPEFKTKPKRWL